MNDPRDLRRVSAKPIRRRTVFWLFAAGVVTLIALLIWRFPLALEEQGTWPRLIYLLCFLALVAGGVFHKGLRARQALRHALIWIGVAGIAGLGYAYRYELASVRDRFLGELMPGVGLHGGGGEISFRADGRGHFSVEAQVEDVPVRFLVDTGASDVVLSPRDAARLGLDPAKLSYTRRYQTANGVVMGAPVILASLRVGPILVRNVSASVNAAPLGTSLLGMSFLERLSGYRVEDGTLILRQ